jgi:hypothetical protein
VTGTTIELRLRDLSGRPRVVEFADHGPSSSPGSALQQRLVGAGANQFVLKSVPREAGSRNGHLFDLLDNEIRAGARLGYVYAQQYPGELTRLAGYNMDVEEPFALFHAYPGKPVSELTGLDDHRRRQLQVGLLRALQLTAAAGVVHGAVTPRSLWWTGTGVRLVDFESARWAGEHRRAGHEPGPVDVRDDVLMAGRVIRHLVLGEASNQGDLGRDPEGLRILLEGVFQPVAQRPYAEDLLRRLKVTVTAPPVTDPEAALAEGRRIFDGFGPPRVPAAATVGGGFEETPPMPGRKRGGGGWRKLFVPMMLIALAGRTGPR